MDVGLSGQRSSGGWVCANMVVVWVVGRLVVGWFLLIWWWLLGIDCEIRIFFFVFFFHFTMKQTLANNFLQFSYNKIYIIKYSHICIFYHTFMLSFD